MGIQNEDSNLSEGALLIDSLSPMIFQLFSTGAFTTYIYVSTALVDLGRFFSSLNYTQSVGLLGRGISPTQSRYLLSEQHNTE
jgi:hypothetical protein